MINARMTAIAGDPSVKTTGLPLDRCMKRPSCQLAHNRLSHPCIISLYTDVGVPDAHVIGEAWAVAPRETARALGLQ